MSSRRHGPYLGGLVAFARCSLVCLSLLLQILSTMKCEPAKLVKSDYRVLWTRVLVTPRTLAIQSLHFSSWTALPTYSVRGRNTEQLAEFVSTTKEVVLFAFVD